MRRCQCCKRQASCPFDQIEGQAIANPTAEHCAVTRVGDEVRKYLKPRAQLSAWQQRRELAESHPDLFVPFALTGRVVVQPFVAGAHATASEARALAKTAADRGLRIHDVVPKNVVGGLIIDFGIVQTGRVRKPRR